MFGAEFRRGVWGGARFGVWGGALARGLRQSPGSGLGRSPGAVFGAESRLGSGAPVRVGGWSPDLGSGVVSRLGAGGRAPTRVWGGAPARGLGRSPGFGKGRGGEQPAAGGPPRKSGRKWNLSPPRRLLHGGDAVSGSGAPPRPPRPLPRPPWAGPRTPHRGRGGPGARGRRRGRPRTRPTRAEAPPSGTGPRGKVLSGSMTHSMSDHTAGQPATPGDPEGIDPSVLDELTRLRDSIDNGEQPAAGGPPRKSGRKWNLSPPRRLLHGGDAVSGSGAPPRPPAPFRAPRGPDPEPPTGVGAVRGPGADAGAGPGRGRRGPKRPRAEPDPGEKYSREA